MTDLADLQQAARVVKDENGMPVVQIPLSLWQEVVGDIETERQAPSQIEQILALLHDWESQPDDKSDEWWQEFDQFLHDNRVNFPERDFGLGDE